MNSENNRPELPVGHRELLKLLVRTGKYFEDLGIDPSLLVSYKRLVRYLRSQHADNLSKILGDVSPRREKAGKEKEVELPAAQISEMPSQVILELALDPKTPRKLLERIADLRFSVTKGALSALRTRDALVEKLRNLIENEATHESIGRAAGPRQ